MCGTLGVLNTKRKIDEGRVLAARDVLAHRAPGTFLSRTSLLKKYFAGGHTYNLYGAKDSVGSSTLIKLFTPADTRLEKKYNFAELKGMSKVSAVYNWKSSVLSFYFEFGVISVITVITVIYFLYKLFKKLSNKQNRLNYNYILLGFLILFIIAISFFNYWMEYTNYVIPQSALFGLIIQKPLDKSLINN